MKFLTNLLFICFFTGLFNSLKAQNYQAFYPGRISYFSNFQNAIKSLRIDSVTNGTYTTLHPFRNIQNLGYGCYTPYGASWIGAKIVVSDGLNIFFNQKNDTIKVLTEAQLNESWIAYDIKDSIKIVAKVIRYDTLSFISLTDSVKTISFQVYDKNMQALNHGLNGKEILLSKNYGLVKTFNFYLFPDMSAIQFPYEPLNEHNLVGLSNPEVGVQNLTWFEVNDFNKGDELHILYRYNSWIISGNYNSEIRKTRLKYISRMNYKDSIIYKIEREEEHTVYHYNPDTVLYSYNHDTISSKIVMDNLFDKLPEEPVFDGNIAYRNYMYKGENIIKIHASAYNNIFYSGDSCWRQPIIDGCFPEYSYIKGLGGPYYDCSGDWLGDGTSNELVYYKKGLKDWGTPLVIGIDEKALNQEISVYPNPFKDFFQVKNVKTKLPYNLEITNLQGQVVLMMDIWNMEQVVNFGNFSPGVYFYKLTGKNLNSKTGKMVKI